MTEFDIARENVFRKLGYLPAKDDGFWGEMGKGFSKEFVSGVGSLGKALQKIDTISLPEDRPGYSLEKWANDTLSTNQQWNAHII